MDVAFNDSEPVHCYLQHYQISDEFETLSLKYMNVLDQENCLLHIFTIHSLWEKESEKSPINLWFFLNLNLTTLRYPIHFIQIFINVFSS